MKQFTLSALSLLLMVAPGTATAQFPGAAQGFLVLGSTDQLMIFAELLETCQTESRLFEQLVQEIDQSSGPGHFKMVLNLDGAGYPGGHAHMRVSFNTQRGHLFLEDYASHLRTFYLNSYGLNLLNLDQFAATRMDQRTGHRVPVAPHPSYGLTKCAALGHELAEALDGYQNGFTYTSNHAVALAFENRMRDEIGQPPRSDDTPVSPGVREIVVGNNRIRLDGNSTPMRIIY